MASRKSPAERARRRAAAQAAQPDAGAVSEPAPQASPEPASAERTTDAPVAPEQRPDPRSRVPYYIIGAFVVLIGAIFFFTRGLDDELVWTAELARADRAFAEGRSDEAARLIVEFGTRWPGARQTFPFNEKAGRYLAAAGRHKDAVEFFERALRLRPGAPNIHAKLAEAQFNSGDVASAIQNYRLELEAGNENNDLANLRLGQILLANRDHVAAMDCFQAIRDREKHAAEIAAALEVVEREVLAPARARAGLAGS